MDQCYSPFISFCHHIKKNQLERLMLVFFFLNKTFVTNVRHFKPALQTNFTQLANISPQMSEKRGCL